MAKRIALVDADALLYLAGFAAQKTKYHVVLGSAASPDTVYQEFFDSVAAIKLHCLERQVEVIERESVTIPEPVEFALSIAKNKMVEMRDQFHDLEVYLKGDGKNWRNSVATLHGYKANRTAPKPLHMEAIRQYLIDHWRAIPVNGKEADDQIATRARDLAIEPVICSIDKDLDQVPGWHWNYSKNVTYYISEQEAEDFFYQQILQGDYADNVHGCWKCGEARAKEIVAEARELSDDGQIQFQRIVWEMILKEYEKSMGLTGCPYGGMPVEHVALENARLVWMQDEPGRLWTPPHWGVKEYVEEEELC